MKHPDNTQALLQSMLQRLKIQQGREGQAYLHSPGPSTASQHNGEQGASSLQKINNSPVNGFEFNGIPTKEERISAAVSSFGIKCGEIKQPHLGCEEDKGLISSSPSQNTDSDYGEKRALGRAGITPTGTGQLFPAKSLKDSTSFERTDRERASLGSTALTRNTSNNKDAVTSVEANQDQGYASKVYMWSLKPNVNAGSQEDKVLHMTNGGFGGKDMQIFPNDSKTTNSSLRRKLRSPESKTGRWTQKIKERWRDRPGSFVKKAKVDEQREEQKSEQETAPETAETVINTSNKEDGRTLLSPDDSDPSKISLPRTEDSNSEGHMRPSGDFEFGLGSFSLLEEIATGQEWAKFLKSSTSPEELKIAPKPLESSQPSPIWNHKGDMNNLSFRSTEASPGLAQLPSDASLSVSMDVSEGKHLVRKEADQSEPMEHGHFQSKREPGDNQRGQPLRPPSFGQLRPADVLNNSALKRVQLNRKRQHQSSERLQTERISDKKETDRAEATSSLSLTSSHVMEETDGVLPLYTLKSPPPPPSPSSFNPFARKPKGVLRHSLSQDSESSVEVDSKRRRVEVNRRVRFSEEVLTIEPPELDLGDTDSEKDSGAEGDSVIEQDCEVEQAVMEEVAPARRPSLPAWIRALKRRNTGRKQR